MALERDPFTGGQPLPQVFYERTPGAAGAPLTPPYRPTRHQENAPLYRIVYHRLQDFLEQAASSGSDYPSFIEKEFRKYLGCKILGRGFARVVCPACKKEHLLALTCKSRVCPSCWNRRAADFAATTVDQFLPELPYRQFVISFPWTMRFALAFHPKFLTRVFRTFVRSLFSWYRLRGRRLGINPGNPGAILLIQKQGSAINVNPHGHLVAADGLFVSPDETRTVDFEPLPPPSNEELQALLDRVASRTIALYQKTYGPDDVYLDPEELPVAHAISNALRAPIPPPAADELPQYDPDELKPKNDLCLQKDGFSLHAGRSIRDTDRKGLEHMLRYGTRAPIAGSRLSIDEEGQVVYRLAKPWGITGATTLRLKPTDFLRRLAMLIPPPYQNLIRYFGVFASRSKLRPRLPPPPPPTQSSSPTRPATKDKSNHANDDESNQANDDQSNHANDDQSNHANDDQVALSTPPKRTYRLPWARLMKRVMDIDPLICPCCKTLMVILAFISDVEIVQKILDHLKIPMNPVPLPLEHGPIQTRLCGLDPTQLDPQLRLDLEVAPATTSTENDTSDCGARDPPP
jgi:hypothetical protein